MARHKTANCTFKFSFPLLPPPPPPLRQNSPTNSRKIVGIKAAPINPRRGFIRRKRRVSSRRDSRVGRDATRQSDPCSRNIYNPRILAWLSHTPTEYRPIFLFARSPCPPVTSTISTGNRRYPRNDVEWRWNEREATLRIRTTSLYSRISLSLSFISLVSFSWEGWYRVTKRGSLISEDRPFFFKMERVWYERLGSSSQ